MRWRREKGAKVGAKVDVDAVLGDGVFAELPEEMAWYLRGAVLYRAGVLGKAVEAWEKVLALPEGERRLRGAWAAWMVGREQESLAAAVPYFERVLDEVEAAGRDPLHLEAAATGWLAKAALGEGDRVGAAKLYYAQHLAGDGSGELSLRSVLLGEIGDEELRRMAADPLLRRLVTARLAGKHGARRHYSSFVTDDEKRDVFAERWLAAVEEAGVELGVEGERLAWLAYGIGDFVRAERWLRACGGETGKIGRWLEAKLWLQRGDVVTAAEILSEVVRGIDRDWREAEVHLNEWDSLSGAAAAEVVGQQESQLLADAAILEVAKAEMADALWLFLKSGYWEDAAYVAERLMETEELVGFVDERFPGVKGGRLDGKSVDEKLELVARGWWWDEEGAAGERIRSLLARRLAREGKLGEAVDYYPDGLREIGRYYWKQMVTGRAEGLRKEARANALWQAAQVMRAFGMELRGTEGEPDAFVYGGALLATPVGSIRTGRAEEEWLRWDEEPMPKVGAVERLMLETNVLPERRYHYRWLAAELAWEAASLMPGDSDETAWVLHIAGSWIRTADPQGADRFYKSMIWRNWETSLARETDYRRWFMYKSGWNQREFQRDLVGRLVKG